VEHSFLFTEQEEFGHYFCTALPNEATTPAPLIFIHGAGGGAWYWRSMMEYFAERGHTCYALDLHGSADPKKALSRKSILDYVALADDFILRIVRARHTHAPVVVGHSMGGLITQKLAERHIFHRVILITPAPPHGIRFRSGGATISLREIFSALRAFVSGAHFVPSRHFVEGTFVDPAASEDMIDAWMAYRTNESPQVLRELFLSEIRVSHEFVHSPMLVIGAEKDRIIHPDIARMIAVYYGAVFVLIPHLGHMCPFESGWEETARLCEVWLSS
jgi:pimeloyl-ACP methyl ester carboxylesterase